MDYRNHYRTFLATALLALVFLSNLALPATGTATSLATPYAPVDHGLSIAEARSLPLGTVVTVEGVVSVPSGAFNSSTFDEGFAIQDHTGGIYVSVADNPELELRRQVRVTGQLADSAGLLVLSNVTDISTHGQGGPKVKALPVVTGAVGEANEGKIIRITGTITQPIFNDLPFGYKVFVNDGSGEIRVYVNASTGIDVSGLSAGQTVEVTGFSSAFIDAELDPRTQADIRVLP